jgi:mediator of RNA polymerase II transcription subunit 6
MAPRAEPVDETVFDNPHAIGDIGFGPGSFAPTELNAQNVLFYFYQSHFFDRNSTNWSVWGGALQSHHTPEGQRLLNDPRAFEAKLNETADPLRGGGIKYTVVAEPKEAGEPWVIQRSNTVRIEETGKWEVRVEGTWYIVGTRIHMAPSLLDILQSRLVSPPLPLSFFLSRRTTS